MAISAAQVKELRERTGSGMMECKKALVEANGDMDAAAEALRKAGMAKADKKAGRVAAEGLVVIEISDDNKTAAMVEVNCETDFVAKKEDFQEFATAIARRVLADDPADIDTLLGLPLHDGDATSIEEARKALIATIGENITVRRLSGSRAGGLPAIATVCVSACWWISRAATRTGQGPGHAYRGARSTAGMCLRGPGAGRMLASEREIFTAQARESGKPDNIIEKMIEGRIRKFLGEITLLGQSFVKDPDQSVGKLLRGRCHRGQFPAHGTRGRHREED